MSVCGSTLEALYRRPLMFDALMIWCFDEWYKRPLMLWCTRCQLVGPPSMLCIEGPWCLMLWWFYAFDDFMLWWLYRRPLMFDACGSTLDALYRRPCVAWPCVVLPWVAMIGPVWLDLVWSDPWCFVQKELLSKFSDRGFARDPEAGGKSANSMRKHWFNN